MKKMKKLASILLAAIMVLAMAVPTMAEEVPTGTQTGSSVTAGSLQEHTFVAYQIFAGEKDGTGKLGNIEWGNGIKIEDFISALKAKEILPTEKTEFTAYEVSLAIEEHKSQILEIAKIASDNVNGLGTELSDISVSENKLTINDTLPDGYYIIVDKTEGNNGENDIFNLSLLQVTGDGALEINVKTDIPSVEKDVQDNDGQVGDSTNLGDSADANNNIEMWGETADYNIGDTVPFRLTATIPSTVNMDQYDSYKVVFHDTMSKGLTFDEIVSVKINGTSITAGYNLEGVTKGARGEAKWTITIDDVKLLDNVKLTENNTIEVMYNAVLNTDAIIGGTLVSGQNENSVYLEYSNQPNGDGTGKTKNDDVYVFTFDIPGTKEDGKKNPLAGASFALYRNEQKDGDTVTSREYANLKERK